MLLAEADGAERKEGLSPNGFMDQPCSVTTGLSVVEDKQISTFLATGLGFSVIYSPNHCVFFFLN